MTVFGGVVFYSFLCLCLTPIKYPNNWKRRCKPRQRAKAATILERMVDATSQEVIWFAVTPLSRAAKQAVLNQEIGGFIVTFLKAS